MLFSNIVRGGAARRDELLDAAQALFASRGYEATTISQIICSVGVSKGAFYHHFAAKEDLVTALAERYAQAVTELAAQVMEDESLDSYSRLIGFFDVIRTHKLSRSKEIRDTFGPLLRDENSDLFIRAHRAVNDVVRPLMTRIITEGVAEQVFDTPDPEAAADTILHLLVSQRELAVRLYSSQSQEALEQAMSVLMRRMAFIGTVIDRILGLPEGSIELADQHFLENLTCGLGETAAA